MRMKKSITSLFLMLACAFSAQAQTESYPFDAADVDANGWLWFDTPEKIEKYVGVSQDGKLDPKGKIFQLITTNSGANAEEPFNKTFASDTLTGYNYKNPSAAYKGAISLHKATQNGTINDGGAVLINLPSCKEMNLMLSTAQSGYAYLSGTNDADADISAYSLLYKPAAAVFPPGMYTPLFSQLNCPFAWTSMETLNNNGESEFTLASSAPVYALVQSASVNPLYIHGVRIVTEETTGINDITADAITFDGNKVSLKNAAEINVYNLNGALIASEYTASMSLSNLAKGVYMVKVGNATQKVVIK